MRIQRAKTYQLAGAQRKRIEDAVLELPDVPLYAVADTLGDVKAAEAAFSVLREHAPRLREHGNRVCEDGSTASRLAVGQYFEQVFDQAGASIRALANRDNTPGLGASLIVCTVLGRYGYIAHVGDTRAYLARQQELRCLTVDHTLAMHQLQRGEINYQDFMTSPFRHTLTQAVGVTLKLEVDIAEIRLSDGDLIMLSSNGLGRVASDELIETHLRDGDLEQAAKALISHARHAQASDDITLLGMEVVSQDTTQPDLVNIETIRNASIFQALEPPQWASLAPYLEEHDLAPGAVLLREGQVHDVFYVIHSGQVALKRKGQARGELGPGSHLGLLNLSVDNESSYTATMLSSGRVFSLNRSRLEQLTRYKPALGTKVNAVLMQAIGQELAETRRELLSMESPGPKTLEP